MMVILKHRDASLRNLAYDANGNILSMTQKGLKINASSIIDSLVYGYAVNSNQLLYVTDKTNDTAAHMGDFTEINNNTTQDYWYDGNGNYTKDNNKGISAVTYNFMNLPEQISVTGKGTINYTYDAGGSKLQKKITEGARVVTYLYSGGFLYKNDTLQYALTAEGRIRYLTKSGMPAYDYFVKDHLGNVRMVLTDEKDTSKYPMASLENTNIATERLLYSGLDSGRVDKSTVPGYPNDGTTSPNDYIQQLSGNGYKIGSGIILKVMSGDQVAIKVSSWYKKNGATPNTPNDLAASLVASLINSLTGAGGPVHGAITSTQLQSSGVIPLSATSFLNNRAVPGSTKPKAYLNWVLLDDQFKFVQSGSGAEQVGDDQEFKLHTPTSNISKNGYLYVFVSNETPNINVFFDNLQVTHLKGPLLEESHYYPFGTEMSAISSHSFPSYVPNRYKANGGAEYGDGEWANNTGLEMYETFYRSYNAHNLSRRRRIGRFMQGDPKMEVSMESYVFAGNNPVMFTDLLGDLSKAELYGIINHLFDTEHGGQWSASDPGRIYVFGDEESGSVFGRMAAMGNPFDFGSEGRESGHNGVWSASGGFYDKGLYPDDAKWVKLEEVVVQAAVRPSFAKLSANYWGAAYTAEKVYFEIGGNVLYNHQSDPDNFVNSCALRMSRALNYSGLAIPYIKGQTLSGADKKWYFYRVSDLRSFLMTKWGYPEEKGDQSELSLYKGLILFDQCNFSDATGHLDIWNGTSCQDECYWDRCSQARLWILK